MANYSPLRYPGGKNRLVKLLELMIDKTDMKNITYIEPFAGGAGVALSLLFSNKVSHIVINDYDKAIYSVWKAILEDTEALINLISNVNISVEEWYRQKEIYINKADKYSLELAFATFFLNRTNRSGILKAGPIGGYSQKGNYLIDARFNKEALIKKIIMISNRKKEITLYNKDVRSFISKYLSNFDNAFMYLDPPYYKRGQELYKNFLNDNDHIEIEKMISELRCKWILTYDIHELISFLYKDYPYRYFDLNYSVATKKRASEIMVVCDNKLWPTLEELDEQRININLRTRE